MAADFKVFKAGLFRSASKISIFKGGVWREVQRIRRWTRIGNTFAWKDVYVKSGTTPTPSPSPTPTPTPTPSVTLSVTATPSAVSGARAGIGVVYTNTTDVNVSNGYPPYTFNFSRSSYSGTVTPAIVINGTDPSKAQFSRDMQGTVPEHQTARFRCIVTDSKGNTGSAYIDADFYTITRSGTGGSGTVNNTGTGSGGAIP